MPFVNVENGGFNAHGLQRFHAADTQNHFLTDAVFAVAAVEFFGNGALGGGVFLQVGV